MRRRSRGKRTRALRSLTEDGSCPMLLPALASFPPFAGSSSSKIDLHRGNGIPRPRDKPPKIAFRPETVSAETETQPQEPAICGVPGRLREISRLLTLSVGTAVLSVA